MYNLSQKYALIEMADGERFAADQVIHAVGIVGVDETITSPCTSLDAAFLMFD